MTTASTANMVRLPLIQTGSIDLACCAVIALGGGYLGARSGGAMGDGLWTLAATIPGMLLPMLILVMMPAKEPGSWGIPVLASTALRAMIVITIGVMVYVLAGPARIVFFLSLFFALIVTLTIDVASVLTLIHRHAADPIPMREAEGVS